MPTVIEAANPGGTPAAVPHMRDLPRFVWMPKGPQAFGVSRTTLYRMGAAGQIRLVKIGRSTFLDTETVLAWLARLPTITPKAAA